VVAVAICLAATIMFSGCDPDGGETPTPTDVKLIKRVDLHYNGDFALFDYDAQNRITKMSHRVYSINYSYPTANTIIMNIIFADTPPLPIEPATFRLNDDGSFAAEEGFSYTNGYLQKIVMDTKVQTEELVEDGTIIQPSEIHYGTMNITCSWSNGNIVTMTEKSTFPTVPLYNTDRTFTVEYGTTPNKPTSIDLAYAFVVFKDFMGAVHYGWLGKSTQYLPTKVMYGSNYVVNYRYETNSEGYVVKIFRKEDSGNEQLYCTISY